MLGPHEASRLWDRHILNCAAVGELISRDDRVVDVGSGAGLPGVVVAILRPDAQVALLEPLQRRSIFLQEVVAELGLDNVAVHRGRAEDRAVRAELGGVEVVTARAVAGLDRLAQWCLPLLRPGGRLLAIKGAHAADELRCHGRAIRRAGGSSAAVRECGSDYLHLPTTVVEIVRRVGDDSPRFVRQSR